MKPTNILIARLQDSGNRITPARGAIVDIFTSSDRPLSVESIRVALTKQKLAVNKTTVYREIEFLLGHDLIRPVNLDSSIKYYEVVTNSHHHHVVCTNCAKFVDVETEGIEEYLEKLEKKLAKKINFKSVRHSLEFFGECINCKNKKK